MIPLAAYALLFLAVGAGFILVHLLAGKLIRPNKPDAEKGTIYECGEPTIGSAWIQFDLRFYVVALLFVIFDVEVAFFFPWAEVFGRANAIATAEKPPPFPAKPAADADEAARAKYKADLEAYAAALNAYAAAVLDLAAPPSGGEEDRQFLEWKRYQEMRAVTAEQLAARTEPPLRASEVENKQADARVLAWLAFGEVLIFFGVLLVGFAYLWRRGDLAWVRSVGSRQAAAGLPPAPAPTAIRELAGAGRP
jgi:NADH-quinone oxidoreductase subunit A